MKDIVSKRLIEAIQARVPPGNKVILRYLHANNSTAGDRTYFDERKPVTDTQGWYVVSPYVTVAALVRTDDPETIIVAVKAYCGRNDNPCRQTGRRVALGRLNVAVEKLCTSITAAGVQL